MIADDGVRFDPLIPSSANSWVCSTGIICCAIGASLVIALWHVILALQGIFVGVQESVFTVDFQYSGLAVAQGVADN